MATGLKILRAITEKRRGWPPNAEFKICALDVLSLLTLTRRDLLREKFRDIVAEEVITGLRSGDVGLLGQRLGLKFVHSDEEPPLVMDQPKPAKGKKSNARAKGRKQGKTAKRGAKKSSRKKK